MRARPGGLRFRFGSLTPPLLGFYAKRYHIKTLLVWCQLVSLLGCLLAAVANRRLLMLLALNMMAISGYSTQPVRDLVFL